MIGSDVDVGQYVKVVKTLTSGGSSLLGKVGEIIGYDVGFPFPLRIKIGREIYAMNLDDVEITDEEPESI